MPGKSISDIGILLELALSNHTEEKKLISLVLPGVEELLARLDSRSVLMKVLLPTLLRPSIAISLVLGGGHSLSLLAEVRK